MKANIYTLGALILICGWWSIAVAASVEESLKYVSSSKDLVEIRPSGNLVLELKYASNDNFMRQNLYGVFNKAFLHQIAAAKLANAAKNLEGAHPNLKLVIFDALRPRSVQFLLWDKVKGTSQEKYVANPKGGSIHNYGFAVDLSIADETGKLLDMGTVFDDFTSLAQPRLEEKFLQAGKLNDRQIKNRLILRTVMQDAGFIQLPLEWWHFDALPKEQVKSKFTIIE